MEHPADPTRRVLADHDAQSLLATPMVLLLPAHQAGIGSSKRCVHASASRSGENEIELLPAARINPSVLP